MAAALLPDPLWDLVEPFLPTTPRRSKGGRPRISDRACLTGILFVLRSGIPWQMLQQELECGSGMTCWRRLRDWQRAGVWDLIHFAVMPSFPCFYRNRVPRLLGPLSGRPWTSVHARPFVIADASDSSYPL